MTNPGSDQAVDEEVGSHCAENGRMVPARPSHTARSICLAAAPAILRQPGMDQDVLGNVGGAW